jgi:hypothetical protein
MRCEPHARMSKNQNVNPGQYKVRGRERQGEEIPHEQEKARASRLMAPAERRRSRAAPPVPKRRGAK